MRKILVLRGGALGDFIVTLPALALLRERWPAATIELVGNATAAALGRTAGLLHAVHSQHEARWNALHGAAPLEEKFAGWLASFDLVVNYWPDPHGDIRAKFCRHAAQVFLTAAALPSRTSAAAHYCEPLGKLGLHSNELVYPLATPNSTARMIAVHPGSGSPSKNWPLDRWAALCQWLQTEHDAHVLVVSGDAESPQLVPHVTQRAHQLALPDLITRLRQCRGFVGHDSGVSHLAAACGVRCLLLFGPTDPAIWAPPATHVKAIRRGTDMNSIILADVQAELRWLLR